MAASRSAPSLGTESRPRRGTDRPSLPGGGKRFSKLRSSYQVGSRPLSAPPPHACVRLPQSPRGEGFRAQRAERGGRDRILITQNPPPRSSASARRRRNTDTAAARDYPAPARGPRHRRAGGGGLLGDAGARLACTSVLSVGVQKRGMLPPSITDITPQLVAQCARYRHDISEVESWRPFAAHLERNGPLRKCRN